MRSSRAPSRSMPGGFHASPQGPGNPVRASTSGGEGAILIPGIVDIHTDHVERHTHPRTTVLWPFLPALMAHDAVVISGGTTTVCDSLSVGASMKRPERREILGPLIAALEEGRRQGAFRADHLLHLRCEVSDPATMALVDATAGPPPDAACLCHGPHARRPAEPGYRPLVHPHDPRDGGRRDHRPHDDGRPSWNAPAPVGRRCAPMWWAAPRPPASPS